MHLNSRIHLGTEMICPYCEGEFVTASGLIHHHELGACPEAETDRRILFLDIQHEDTNRRISKLTPGWEPMAGPDWAYKATEESWNGEAWECEVCPRKFETMKQLNQHYGSPAHLSLLYHCPKASCRKDFTTLAGLIHHLESEKCGTTRFFQIQRAVKRFIPGDGPLFYREYGGLPIFE